MDKILLNINEISQTLSLKVPTVRKWIKTAGFPCVRLGRKAVRFKLEDVQQWINKQQQNTLCEGE